MSVTAERVAVLELLYETSTELAAAETHREKRGANHILEIERVESDRDEHA